MFLPQPFPPLPAHFIIPTVSLPITFNCCEQLTGLFLLSGVQREGSLLIWSRNGAVKVMKEQKEKKTGTIEQKMKRGYEHRSILWGKLVLMNRLARVPW